MFGDYFGYVYVDKKKKRLMIKLDSQPYFMFKGAKRKESAETWNMTHWGNKEGKCNLKIKDYVPPAVRENREYAESMFFEHHAGLTPVDLGSGGHI